LSWVANNLAFGTSIFIVIIISAPNFCLEPVALFCHLRRPIHGQTPAEVIVERAHHKKDNMGLATWKDAPDGKIQKFDVSIAKNDMTANQMAQLQRLNSYQCLQSFG
jgi:Virulence protein RhuM family